MEGSNLEVRSVDNDQCANCLKRATGGQTYKQCSACKNAHCCCRECQRAHWKIHKPKCKQHTASKQLATESGHKRELRLLQEWRRQVKNAGTLACMLVNHFGRDRLSRLQEDGAVIALTLDFDFNKRNFVPTDEPAIVTVNELGGPKAEELRNCCASMPPPPSSNSCNVVILLMVKDVEGIAGLMSHAIEFPDTELANASWAELQELLNVVKLESPKFSSWPALLQQNLKSAVGSKVTCNPQFQPFPSNALCIESANSRHKTHVVFVRMEMGHGLGQIKRLESYTVDPVSNVISSLEQANAGGVDNAWIRQELDLENNPRLVASRRQCRCNCYLPVVFFCRRTAVLLMTPNFMEVCPGHQQHPVKQCNKKAKAAFQKLQMIKFPTVESPELHWC